MIRRSDNTAATTLWHLLGGASDVAAFDRLVPMPATTPHPAWGLTTTTGLIVFRAGERIARRRGTRSET